MREIKFRGKAIETPDFLDGHYIPHENGWVTGNLILSGNIAIIAGVIADAEDYLIHEWWATVDRKTVGEYVGVRDVAGNEIYEGDIIQICYDDDDWDTESYRSVVKWLGDGKWSEPVFDLDPQHLKGWSWHFDGNVLSSLALAEIYRYEIIGNIHDHSELLNKEGAQ